MIKDWKYWNWGKKRIAVTSVSNKIQLIPLCRIKIVPSFVAYICLTIDCVHELCCDYSLGNCPILKSRSIKINGMQWKKIIIIKIIRFEGKKILRKVNYKKYLYVSNTRKNEVGIIPKKFFKVEKLKSEIRFLYYYFSSRRKGLEEINSAMEIQ